MASDSGVPKRDFQFFLEIIDSFKACAESAVDGDLSHMKVAPFCEAMTMFLRIFDAFSNPFFSDVVKKDVQGNITKLKAAGEKTGAETIKQVIEIETEDASYLKLIKKETGGAQNSGTVALLWMKRTMQFILGLLNLLVSDSKISLSSASRKSYATSLKHCHNFITRGAFDTGLRFAPNKETFYANLTGGEDVQKVEVAMNDFVVVFQPQVDAIVQFYLQKDLEPYIKP